MTTRRASVSATGGRMLNPSVEPTARRESELERRRESQGEKIVARGSFENWTTGYDDGGDNSDEKDRSALQLMDESSSSATGAAALEARNQRRSIGLKRLSLNEDLKETLLQALEGVAHEMRMSLERAAGIEKLQAIMTKAKEKGFGASKLFQFFLLESDKGNRRGSNSKTQNKSKFSEPSPEESNESTEDMNPSGAAHTTGANIFKDTATSKMRAEALKVSEPNVKKPMDRMPSLNKDKRPSTASSKRGSGSSSRLGTTRNPVGEEEGSLATSGGDVSTAFSGWRRSVTRRTSEGEEVMIRDRVITSGSFRQGLATLGFKLTDEETTTMFKHLDANCDGKIDIAEFTKFCLEIPSMAWKAERARRGILTGNPGVDSNRELEKAAREMAIETVSAVDEAGKRSVAAASGGDTGSAAVEPTAPPVRLGKTVFKGEKFFWRTKDLIEVVIQLNADKDFLSINTFHTDTLEVYPIIFVDPAKIPINAAAIAVHTKVLEDQELEAKQAARMGLVGTDKTGFSEDKEVDIEGSEKQTLVGKAHMLYIADYLLHRLSMPDENGNLLQPDVTQPGVQINPELYSAESSSKAKLREVAAKPRPGLMKTTFDEWDTLLIPNPPSNVVGAPEFSKSKKRESYFKEFLSKKGEFDENRVKAQRLSAEAEVCAQEVSNLMKKLEPLNYSASAPAILRDEQILAPSEPLAGADPTAKIGGISKVVLSDGLSQSMTATRHESTSTSLWESQSAPVLLTHESAAT